MRKRRWIMVYLVLCLMIAGFGVNSSAAEEQTDAAQETDVSGYPVFDFGSRTVMLNSGYEMPILGVDYIDLMILHHSQPSNDVDAYQAMERAVEAGKLQLFWRAGSRWVAEGIHRRFSMMKPSAVLQRHTAFLPRR